MKGGSISADQVEVPPVDMSVYMKGADAFEASSNKALAALTQGTMTQQNFMNAISAQQQNSLVAYTSAGSNAMGALAGLSGLSYTDPAEGRDSAKLMTALADLNSVVGAANSIRSANGDTTTAYGLASEKLFQIKDMISNPNTKIPESQRSSIGAQLEAIRNMGNTAFNPNNASGQPADNAERPTFLNNIETTRKMVNGTPEEQRQWASPNTTPTAAPTQEQVNAQLTNTPGYQFALNQGQQALDRSQAARGMLNSGNAMVEAQQFGQGLASQQLANERAALANIAGLGQPALGLSTQGYLNQIGQSNTLAGTQIATQNANYMAQGQSRQGAFNTLGAANLQYAGLQTQASIANQQANLQADSANAARGDAMMGGIGKLAGTLLGGLF